jgi:nucleoside phosphorylase
VSPKLLLVAAAERELCAADRVETLCCGIGPVEAALATAHALARTRYAALLHVGIAGAAALPPGTVVIGSEAVYCDVIDPASTLPRIHTIQASPELVAAARRVLPGAPVLPIGTAARVGRATGFEVEAMEGFGVLRAAALAGVPGVEIRVISNAMHDADRSRWRIAEALDVLRATVPRVVRALLDAGRRGE